MRLSRIAVKNFRSLKIVDVPVVERTSCIIGKNNTGKSNLIHALRFCLDVTLYVSEQDRFNNPPSRFLGDEGVGVV